MELIGYKRPDKEFWNGRVDCDTEYESFRWHQIIKLVSLDEDFLVENDAYVIISYKVDAGIVRNQGRSGARRAPDLIKQHLSNRPCSFDSNVNIYDGGSVVCVNGDVETAQATLAILVERVLENGGFPIVIGGGHDVSLGSMRGIINYSDSNETFGIVNFDAHFDNRPSDISTSGTMFRQVENDFVARNINYNHLTIGVQKSANTKRLFNDMDNAGGKYILARDIKITASHHNNQIIEEFIRKNDNIYITICCDVFSSAFAPGVSSPQPLGISPDDFMEFFKTLLLSKKVVCLDIAEVSPELDNSNITVSLVSLIIYTLVNFNSEHRV